MQVQPQPEQLVRRAQGQDRAAFTELVRRHERRILAFFLARTSGPAVAEDLAQETFLRAYARLGELADPARFPAWLQAIARNAYREWARERKKHASPPRLPEREEPPLLERKTALHRDIYRIVHELPEPYREVLLLRYFEGASTPQIAAKLGRPLGTVTKQISRAHAHVAARVKNLRGHTTLLHFLLAEEGEDEANGAGA